MASIEGALVGHLVRESLESVLESSVASALIFEALSESGEQGLPTEAEPLKRFLTSAIQPRLEERLGPTTAETVVSQLHALVDSALARPARRPSQLPTASQRVDQGPVRVLVVASTPALANRLQAALGPELCASYLAPTAEMCARVLGGLRPPIVIVDTTGDLPFPLDALVALMRREKVLLLVWGSDSENGKRVLDVLAGPRGTTVGLRPDDGAEPLMDYVLSRSAQPEPEP